MKLKSLFIAGLLGSLSFSALADRIITDQLDCCAIGCYKTDCWCAF